jgi:hypothetical protein
MVEENWKEEAEKGWGLLSWEGEVQWFGTKEDFKKKRVMGGRLCSLEALIGTIRNAEALGWNLYLNANPSRAAGKQKLARGDITHWRYIVVDLDPGADALLPPEPANWESRLPDEHLSKAHRIFSGRGYQFWLPLYNCPVSNSTTGYLMADAEGHIRVYMAADWERIMSGYLRALKNSSESWAPGWIIDTACSDLARVVRCPGSVNQKTGRLAVVEHVAAGPELDVSALLRYNLPLVSQEIVKPFETSNLLDILPHLNVRARTFILEGASSPGRHNACYATAKNLHELGVPHDRAFEWLLIGAGKSHTGWPSELPAFEFSHPLSQSEVERIVKQVYGDA